MCDWGRSFVTILSMFDKDKIRCQGEVKTSREDPSYQSNHLAMLRVVQAGKEKGNLQKEEATR